MVYRMILLSHVFCSLIISHTDCIRVTPGLYYSAAYIQIQIRVKEKKGRGSFEETRGSMVQICDICSSVSFKRKSDKTSSSSIELSNQLFFLFTLTSRIFQDLNFVRIMSRLPEKIAGILFIVQLEL